jgi:hypothetical protein
MTTADHITPTKEDPVFNAYNDWFGFISNGLYKDYMVDTGDCLSCGHTFGVRFAKAVNDLHQWITENEWVFAEYPKSKFGIEMIDGSLKKGEVKYVKVYEISAAKAKKLLF